MATRAGGDGVTEAGAVTEAASDTRSSTADAGEVTVEAADSTRAGALGVTEERLTAESETEGVDARLLAGADTELGTGTELDAAAATLAADWLVGTEAELGREEKKKGALSL